MLKTDMFAGLELARRLEGAEGAACRECAETRGSEFPESGAGWAEIAGACAVFDGPDSPITQSFSLGLWSTPAAGELDLLTEFFHGQGAPADHEVSPLAGVRTVELLAERGYRPTEFSTVLYRAVEAPAIRANTSTPILCWQCEQADVPLWVSTATAGWGEVASGISDLADTFRIVASRPGALSFLASLEGQASAAASLFIHEGVAVFAGASTIPSARGRGLQRALLALRMHYAYEAGCDIAMVCTEPGSSSQRNAERQGFRVAYTRTKWRLDLPG